MGSLTTHKHFCCIFSLFKGTTGNAADTLIDDDHESKQANFSDDFPKSLYFSLHCRSDTVDCFATHDIDADNGLKKSAPNNEKRVNMILIEIN